MSHSIATFRSMGTEVEVLAVPDLPQKTLDAVRIRFEEVEAALTRFRPESELSRLNAYGGQPFSASPLLFAVLRGSLEAARKSKGLFDPTVLDAVESAGYRLSFEEVQGTLLERKPAHRCSYLDVDLWEDGSVLLWRGARVDLGGYAKGWTVDDVAGLMEDCESWLVNAGGDLRAQGRGPLGDGWLVGIEDPLNPAKDVGAIRVWDAAVATSSVARRHWLTQEGPAHHIIDPRTGRPGETGLLAVTALADTATEAEVLAKTVFLLGKQDGLGYVESNERWGAVIISNDGMVTWSRRMEDIREN